MKSQPKSGKKIKLSESYWTLAIALAIAGPFALPLLWKNSRFSKTAKIWLSIAVIVITLVFMTGLVGLVHTVMQSLDQLKTIE